MPEELFTAKMRYATREIHDISDALVNAKLAVAMSDTHVWADGLLVFYEIFRYLEDAIDRLPDSYVSDMCIDGMKRTRAFQEDLNYYLTTSWTNNYVIRESVAKYLLHLQTLEATHQILLIPYIYHLYMGLLTGAQILSKKRQLMGNTICGEWGGNSVTQFGNKHPYEIKYELKATMNGIAEVLPEDVKLLIIEESKTVFALNNELIRSVRGTTRVVVRKVLKTLAIILVVPFAFFLYKSIF